MCIAHTIAWYHCWCLVPIRNQLVLLFAEWDHRDHFHFWESVSLRLLFLQWHLFHLLVPHVESHRLPLPWGCCAVGYAFLGPVALCSSHAAAFPLGGLVLDGGSCWVYKCTASSSFPWILPGPEHWHCQAFLSCEQSARLSDRHKFRSLKQSHLPSFTL